MAVGTYKAKATRGAGATEQWTGTSGAASAQTISTDTTTDPAVVRRLLWVAIKYSASPTQAGTTVVFNSGTGSGYDTTLNTGSSNAQNNVYEPTAEIRILPADAIDVTAPSGGGAITSSITICTEML